MEFYHEDEVFLVIIQWPTSVESGGGVSINVMYMRSLYYHTLPGQRQGKIYTSYICHL